MIAAEVTTLQAKPSTNQMSRPSPLEIVKRTPMSNCGECGYPTCLAFAAAVVSTGLAPNSCPFIDTTGLKLEAIASDTCLPEEKDLDFITYLKEKIAAFDFPKVAPLLGAEFVPGNDDTLRFRYLGQDIKLSKKTISIDGHPPEDHRDQILLYNYVHGASTTPPTDDWVGLESLPNSISKVKTLATYCEERLALLFTKQPSETVYKNLTKLGATFPEDNPADIAAVLQVLPMVPQYLLFWEEEPEDNFEAKTKVLFDRQVSNFLDLESLVFSAERLSDRITEIWDKDA